MRWIIISVYFCSLDWTLDRGSGIYLPYEVRRMASRGYPAAWREGCETDAFGAAVSNLRAIRVNPTKSFL